MAWWKGGDLAERWWLGGKVVTWQKDGDPTFRGRFFDFPGAFSRLLDPRNSAAKVSPVIFQVFCVRRVKTERTGVCEVRLKVWFMRLTV